jgi:hypothetical protein
MHHHKKEQSTLSAMFCSFSSREQSSGQPSLVSLIRCTMHALLRLGQLQSEKASTVLAHLLIVVMAANHLFPQPHHVL